MKDKIIEILEEFKVFEKTLDDNTVIDSAIDHHKMALYECRRQLATRIAALDEWVSIPDRYPNIGDECWYVCIKTGTVERDSI